MIEKNDFAKSMNISSNVLKSLIDSHSVFAVTDIGGIITYANDKFVDLSKYSKEELIGSNHNILRSDEHSDEFFEELWNTILSRKIWHGDIKNKAKDGSLYWLKTTILPLLHDDGRVMGFATLRTDITEQKKQQEHLEEQDEILEIKNLKLEAELLKKQKQIIQDERLSSIGHLASRLAHDIRNPLSVIQITFENFKTGYGMNEIQKKQFEKIQRSIFRITHQIDDVLDFVKEQPLVLKKTKISDVTFDALDSLFIPNDIRLKLPKNDIELICDSKKLSIAFNNIILNAIQAMDGKGTVEITHGEDSDAVIIQVKDSGKGISKEEQDKIFEPLFTTKQTGTGLGLASVKSIIKSHGGIISVTSPPTIFTIKLPKRTD